MTGRSATPPDVTPRLCRFLAGTALDDLPPEVVERTRYLLLDGIGCGLVAAVSRGRSSPSPARSPSTAPASPRCGVEPPVTPSPRRCSTARSCRASARRLPPARCPAFRRGVVPAALAATETRGGMRFDHFLGALALGFEVGRVSGRHSAEPRSPPRVGTAVRCSPFALPPRGRVRPRRAVRERPRQRRHRRSADGGAVQVDGEADASRHGRAGRAPRRGAGRCRVRRHRARHRAPIRRTGNDDARRRRCRRPQLAVVRARDAVGAARHRDQAPRLPDHAALGRRRVARLPARRWWRRTGCRGGRRADRDRGQ